MEQFPIETIDVAKHFPQLNEIPQPPARLRMRGSLERVAGTVLVTVVGSRSYSAYGKYVCEKLIKGLAGQPVTIVSGLAIGIDAIAHQAALDAGLPTVAFPGSGLDWEAIYPKQHRMLAERILQSGGALLSEFENDLHGAPWTFPTRNRLQAGISTMTIVIEAAELSGTLITARLATEYSRIVGAVPGAVTSLTSAGANKLLKLGAVPITNSDDILIELNLQRQSPLPFPREETLSAAERSVLSLLAVPLSKEAVIIRLSLDPVTASMVFSMLEIKGLITETYGLLERTI